MSLRPLEHHAAQSAMPKPSPYEHGLDKNDANYAPLSPISLIARTAYTYPQQLAVVHADRRLTWAETYARSRRLASALVRAGIGPGQTVAVMASNTPEMI
jgi:fatty-acyl-CoA synthase